MAFAPGKLPNDYGGEQFLIELNTSKSIYKPSTWDTQAQDLIYVKEHVKKYLNFSYISVQACPRRKRHIHQTRMKKSELLPGSRRVTTTLYLEQYSTNVGWAPS